MVLLKRLTTIALICGFVLGSVLLTSASATSNMDVNSQEGGNLVVNGKAIQPDVPAQIINDRTMVPVRFVAENLGLTVDYDSSTSTVIIRQGDMVVKLLIGGKAYKNDQEIPLDVPAMIINNRTLVPVRFISEAFGATVVWDGTSRTVTITKESSINVISPNGGEILPVGTAVDITWSYISGCSSDVRISLYKGEQFQYVIAPNVPAKSGKYRWTIPMSQVVGDKYKIRISCNANIEIFDISDTNFTITTIAVTAPNGGESCPAGTTKDITWSYAGMGCSSDVRISLYKGEQFQYVIAPKVPAEAGTYKWTIPSSQANGSDYKIRVSCNTNTAVCDYSDTNFSISPIAVYSPNGGESLSVGTTKDITWSYTGMGCSSDVRISLYKGEQFQYVIAPKVPAEAGTYKWTIPSSQANGSDYKIRVSCNANTAVCDYSNTSFSISPIAVTTPKGGEVWHKGSVKEISWSYSGAGCSSDVRISLYRGEQFQYVIAQNMPVKAGTYKWTIPLKQATGNDYRIRVTCNGNIAIYDLSDMYFSIN